MNTPNDDKTIPNTEEMDMVVSLQDYFSETLCEDDNGHCAASASVIEENGNFMPDAMEDQVTAKLVSSGSAGAVTAAAVISAKKKNLSYAFETNPSVRKRQKCRLIKKLNKIVDEYTTRIGQQAIVLYATPGIPFGSYKVHGAKPLKDIIQNLQPTIMADLETAIAHYIPPPAVDPTLFKLPPLVIENIPTSVEKMTQAQMRTFIPFMLRYSTGRGKPGWGKEITRPPWWPVGIPWRNVRVDERTEEEKMELPWSSVLRKIIISCYKYHEREDLLTAYNQAEQQANTAAVDEVNVYTTNGTFQVIEVDSSGSIPQNLRNSPVLQVNANSPVFTLPDGTSATLLTSNNETESGTYVLEIEPAPEEDIAPVVHVQGEVIRVANVKEANGQYIINSEDGQIYTSVNGLTLYQPVMGNIQQLMSADGEISVTAVVQQSNDDSNYGSSMEILPTTEITDHSNGTQTQSSNSSPVFLINNAIDFIKDIGKVSGIKLE